MDEFASESHHRLARAYAEAEWKKLVPIIDNKGTVYSQDDGMRPDSTR